MGQQLIAVSVVSGNIEETHKRWKLEAAAWPEHARPTSAGLPTSVPFDALPLTSVHWPKPDYRLLGSDPCNFGPAIPNASSFGGFFLVFDVESGECVWRKDWGDTIATPSGFAFDGDQVWLADLEGCNLFQIDMADEPGRILRRVSHPALNDVHYVVRTRRGLLVASTGTDMVIELDLDGESLYQWWAGDHGFTETPAGIERLPDRHREHRTEYYHTRYQTTHLNAARYRDPEERYLLVLLWKQGMLVEVDTALPPEQQMPRVVLDGLYRPHSIRPLPDGGWLVVNTQGAELVLLTPDLDVARRIPSITDWIQDAAPLGDDRWLVADVNNRRLLVHDGSGKHLHEIPFDRNWRVYGVDTLAPAIAQRLVQGSMALSTT